MAAPDLGSMFSGIMGTGTGIAQTIAIVIAIIIVMFLVFGGLFMLYWTRKKYNLKVEIKKPRSDGCLA